MASENLVVNIEERIAADGRFLGGNGADLAKLFHILGRDNVPYAVMVTTEFTKILLNDPAIVDLVNELDAVLNKDDEEEAKKITKKIVCIIEKIKKQPCLIALLEEKTDEYSVIVTSEYVKVPLNFKKNVNNKINVEKNQEININTLSKEKKRPSALPNFLINRQIFYSLIILSWLLFSVLFLTGILVVDPKNPTTALILGYVVCSSMLSTITFIKKTADRTYSDLVE